MLISRFIRLLQAWWRYNESVRNLHASMTASLPTLAFRAPRSTHCLAQRARGVTPSQRIRKRPPHQRAFSIAENDHARSALSFHFSSFMMSGYSPLLCVQPSISPFLTVSLLPHDRRSCEAGLPIPPRDSGDSISWWRRSPISAITAVRRSCSWSCRGNRTARDRPHGQSPRAPSRSRCRLPTRRACRTTPWWPQVRGARRSRPRR